MADHYAWKGPCQILQKWLQRQIRAENPIKDVCSWNNIIAYLEERKYFQSAEFAKKIKIVCDEIDSHKGKGEGEDRHQINATEFQQKLNKFMQSCLTNKKEKPYELIEELRNRNHLLFDDRFEGQWNQLNFNNQQQMILFKQRVLKYSEDCLKWIYDHNINI